MNKKKLNAIRIFLIILTLSVMAIIFALSADTADESDAKSDAISDSIVFQILNNFDLTDEQIDMLVRRCVVIVRKTAHFAEYAALGFLLASVFVSFGLKTKLNVPISFIIGVLYAVSDEIHQYFVPGRSCQISDMLLDSAGVITGILVLLSGVCIFKKIHTKKLRD